MTTAPQTQRRGTWFARSLAALPPRFAELTLRAVLRASQLTVVRERHRKTRDRTQQGFARAFPEDNPETHTAHWSRRQDDLQTKTLLLLCRRSAGRVDDYSDLIDSALEEAMFRRSLIVNVHTGLDPLPQLALLEAARSGDNNVLWAALPVREHDDPRAVVSRLIGMPSTVRDSVLSVASPLWPARGVAHIRSGEAVLLGIDTPFQGRERDGVARLVVGESALELSATIDRICHLAGAALWFARPEWTSGGRWRMMVTRERAAEDVAEAASDWVARHRYDWASYFCLVDSVPVTALRGVIGR